MSDIKRWHDESEKLTELLSVFQQMSEKELNEISKYLFQVVNIYWKQKLAKDDNLSIGRDKLFGYYKSYNKKRWYDQNASLRSALSKLGTMDPKEIDEIMDGFIIALKESGMYDMYDKKKQQLDN